MASAQARVSSIAIRVSALPTPCLLNVTIAALAGGTDGWAQSGRPLESGGALLSPATDVYRRPYEGTDIDPAVMQAYLDWEYGLVAQLERDGTHGFRVLLP